MYYQTTVAYEHNPNRAIFLERDLVRNEVLKSAQVETPGCVHDVLGGLLALRGVTLEPGQSVLSPVSDGRRAAQVKGGRAGTGRSHDSRGQIRKPCATKSI